MKKRFRLLLVGMLSVTLMFSSVIPVAAEDCDVIPVAEDFDVISAVVEDCDVIKISNRYTDINAYLSGPNSAARQITLDPVCYLYGYASCESGTGMGNICLWKAKQGGSEPLAGTNTAASFGKNGSATNIMIKSPMVTTYPTLLHYYEKSAPPFTYYTQATTRLYY